MGGMNVGPHCVTLDEDQYRALAALAEQEGQSVDALVRQAIYQLLAKRQPTGPLSPRPQAS